MIVGEREIITQVRNAFETSRANGLTGDFIRLLIKKVIETAKKVYTETNISKKPISVVFFGLSEIKEFEYFFRIKVSDCGCWTNQFYNVQIP